MPIIVNHSKLSTVGKFHGQVLNNTNFGVNNISALIQIEDLFIITIMT